MKWSGRDKSVLVVVHMCMEKMLGISLYSYLYLKLEKVLSFLLLFMFSLQQNRRRGQNRFCLEARGVGGKEYRGRDGPSNIYTYE
jgi:hypothetical protein